jgi:hypothetical protein
VQYTAHDFSVNTVHSKHWHQPAWISIFSNGEDLSGPTISTYVTTVTICWAEGYSLSSCVSSGSPCQEEGRGGRQESRVLRTEMRSLLKKKKLSSILKRIVFWFRTGITQSVLQFTTGRTARGSNPSGRGRDFLHLRRPDLGPTNSPTQRAPGNSWD